MDRALNRAYLLPIAAQQWEFDLPRIRGAKIQADDQAIVQGGQFSNRPRNGLGGGRSIAGEVRATFIITPTCGANWEREIHGVRYEMGLAKEAVAINSLAVKRIVLWRREELARCSRRGSEFSFWLKAPFQPSSLEATGDSGEHGGVVRRSWMKRKMRASPSWNHGPLRWTGHDDSGNAANIMCGGQNSEHRI